MGLLGLKKNLKHRGKIPSVGFKPCSGGPFSKYQWLRADSSRHFVLPFGGIFDTQSERKDENDVEGYSELTKRCFLRKQLKPRALDCVKYRVSGICEA
ncbi:MAG: hypothetical protein COY19_01365 [Candidatus Marinimicrobia bacterium CG_4_10_14_0_2_um_filter_48_9]|nr:MAG: hypothetical protein COY19_01365 [Candidatus Marinimicrobia bacterium CG_4_10_14_0_2_um_filter_48_9]